MKDYELLFILIITIIIIYFYLNNESNSKQRCKRKENFIEQPELKATFYEHCNYEGASFQLGPGYHDIEKIKNIYISSVRVPYGLTVKLYEKKSFQGRTLITSSDIPCLSNFNFNDITSSIFIYKDSTSAYNTIKSGYIEKDYLIYGTDPDLFQIYDTLENCKKRCDNAWACVAFSRPKMAIDELEDQCWLKKDYDMKTNRKINLFEIPHHPEWKTYVKYKGEQEKNNNQNVIKEVKSTEVENKTCNRRDQTKCIFKDYTRIGSDCISPQNGQDGYNATSLANYQNYEFINWLNHLYNRNAGWDSNKGERANVVEYVNRCKNNPEYSYLNNTNAAR